MLNAILQKQGVARNVSDDASVPIVIKYVGPESSGSVAVTLGVITLESGGVADPTVKSGTTDGTIDPADAGANTLGKIVDLINNSSNWKAYLKDGVRADAGTGLLDRAATTLSPNVTEVSLYADTSATLNLTARIGSRTNVNGTEDKAASEVVRIISNNTYTLGTNTIKVYKVNEERQTEELLFSKAGGASGVEQDIDFAKEGLGSLAVSKTGEHLVVRMEGSDECTGYLTVIGLTSRGA